MLCGLAGLVVFVSLAASAAPAAPETNVLLITIDTLRADRLSCYDPRHAATPRIDELADRGVRFTRAFAHTPTTLPSHTSILLGTVPPHHGIHDNSSFIVREESVTMAEHLKSRGYATAAFVGAFPLDSRFGLDQGFDVYDDNCGSQSEQLFSYVERRSEVVIDKALAWLETVPAGRPWFLWVHCYDPHQRYDPPEPFKTRFADHPYEGEVAYVDAQLGRLWDTLDRGRLFEKTLIVLTADHGESLGEHGESTHGYFAYNSTLWIPLIVAYPGINPGTCEQEVCHVDIFPTVCEVIGIGPPRVQHGMSLKSAAEGEKLPVREIYCESLYAYYNRGWAPVRGFIRDREKFLDSPIPELYDLNRDFQEDRNLAADSGSSLKRHRRRLQDYLDSHGGANEAARTRTIDRKTLEKLKSLGYIGGIPSETKEKFTAADDLKTLLPFQDKFQKAIAAYNNGAAAESETALREIITERPDFDQAFSYLATVLKEQGRWPEAVTVMEEGLRNNPRSYSLITTFGLVLIEAGRFDQAIAVLKQGLDQIDYDPDLWNYLGMAYWRLGDFDRALENFQRALSLDQNSPVVHNNLGSLFLSRAVERKSSEDLRQAIRYFQAAIGFDPEYASAYNGLGSAWGRAGDLDAAIANWEQAVSLKPDFAFPLYNLGLSHLARGNKAKALEYFTRYKQGFYQTITEDERHKLDALIAKCR
jgi:arylsulfatase A-like enzyme/Flp pilus assembly protein TadD